MTSHVRESEQLRHIRSLRELIPFLRDELDWPIDSEDPEDITFDYDARDLGLDESAARRQRCWRRRLMIDRQPSVCLIWLTQPPKSFSGVGRSLTYTLPYPPGHDLRKFPVRFGFPRAADRLS